MAAPAGYEPADELPLRGERYAADLQRRLTVAVDAAEQQACRRLGDAADGQRADRRQHDPVRALRTVPAAEDRIGGKRHRLASVHARGARRSYSA